MRRLCSLTRSDFVFYFHVNTWRAENAGVNKCEVMNTKTVKKVAAWIAALYLVASLILSALVTFNVKHYEITTHRAPFLVVELERTTISQTRSNGTTCGYSRNGHYIGFGLPSEGFEIGADVLSVFLWSPLNNCCDGIEGRFDVVL